MSLCNSLVFNRLKPYYLFQGDLVEGTAHLRVPIKRGLELEAALRQRLSGLAMPTYAVDLPQGGGKVPLINQYLSSEVEEGLGKTCDGETGGTSIRLLADKPQYRVDRPVRSFWCSAYPPPPCSVVIFPTEGPPAPQGLRRQRFPRVLQRLPGCQGLWVPQWLV